MSYLPKNGDADDVIKIVEEKVSEKKKLGINPIIMKAHWLEEDVRIELVKKDPNHKVAKCNRIYRQQLTYKAMRTIGFVKECQHTNMPALILRW